MMNRIKEIVKFGLEGSRFTNINRNVLELNNVQELKKLFNWTEDGILAREDIHDFDYAEDLNERRVRDAEVLSTVLRNRNAEGTTVVEIGTSTGMATALMSVNAPKTRIYTVNIPPEEIISGEGGNFTTIALEKEKIGHVYKSKNLTNIEQIFANTKYWKPEIGKIDIAFIDGCHDTEFVINDTLKIIPFMKPGSLILWHDFNPELITKYDWIRDVCLGVEKLYTRGVLKNRVYHLKDSWIGVYKV
jgi:predicted O-methyltransferase YrrM